MPYRDSPGSIYYSQADIANKLYSVSQHMHKNYLQNAMYALCDALGMIARTHPELGTQEAWLDRCRTEPLHAGIVGGEYKKATVGQQLTEATLAIGRGQYAEAVEKLIVAARMLVWIGESKNKALKIEAGAR